MGKQGKRVLKVNANLIFEIDILEKELINVKKENRDLICENNFLQEELTQLINKINIERWTFLNQINVYIDANGEIE